MRKSTYNWLIEAENPESTHLVPWLKENKLPEFLGNMLFKRGIKSNEEAEAFFHPNLEQLHDPYLLFDMEKAVERIHQGIEAGERILIYGDYDADGITSTTVLKDAIEMIGGDVEYYLPDRFKDGYGPNRDTYERLIAERGIQLIVTVDNGVSGHEAIQFAQESGVDIIITDHHELPEALPNAYAIIHPSHPKGTYPFKELAGVGVAFKVATALLDEVPTEMLDLVAIGTIADLVSLTGENRVLVKLGLEIIRQSDRIGLLALCKKADVKQVEITEETIGFSIGPRLNAIGRLGDASPGVQLLSTFDEEEAVRLADFIQEKNAERQKIVADITKEALELVASLPTQSIYVLSKVGWHSGVLGIVASRIVQETGRPALVLGIDKETGIAKGSGRSVSQVNLFETLSAASDLFTAFGGHHMAAGVTIDEGNIEAAQETLSTYLEKKEIDFSTGPEMMIEGKISIKNISVEFIEQLNSLAPFGTDNPFPYFLIETEQPKQVKQLGADKQHLKFQLIESKDTLDCIAFNFGEALNEIEPASEVEVVGQLTINEWNGNRLPQLSLRDFQITGYQFFDYRGHQFNLTNHLVNQTVFVIFDSRYKKELVDVPPQNILLISEETLLENDWQSFATSEELVFVDCPNEEQILKAVFHKLSVSRVSFYLYSKDQAYLNGMPNRDQFAKLFSFIKKYQLVDVRHKTAFIANYLKIELSLVIFMIQVFFELGFVTIENGVMNRVEKPDSRALDESKSYQTRLKKIKTEEFLLYSAMSAIEVWLLSQEEQK